MSDHISVAYHDNVALLRIDRPQKLGALTKEMLVDLCAALQTAGNAEGSRGIVLSGTGGVFSTGGDLTQVLDATPESLGEFVRLFHDVTLIMLAMPVPVIAALDGWVVGGAAEIVLSCDARLGTKETRYLFPENPMGLTISNGASYLLPRMVGSRALRLVLDAQPLNAEQALELGLLDTIVDGDLEQQAVDLVRSWTAPGSSTAWHLQLLRPPLREVKAAMQREAQTSLQALQTGASRRSLQRFFQRRKLG